MTQVGGMDGSNLIRVTPVLYAGDVDKAAAFFAGTLGFHVGFRSGAYAYVFRETAAFRIFEGANPQPTDRMTAYIDVEDIGALWAEIKDALEALEPGAFEGPLDRVYGQRELIVRMPDGGLLVFGQTL